MEDDSTTINVDTTIEMSKSDQMDEIEGITIHFENIDEHEHHQQMNDRKTHKNQQHTISTPHHHHHHHHHHQSPTQSQSPSQSPSQSKRLKYPIQHSDSNYNENKNNKQKANSPIATLPLSQSPSPRTIQSKYYYYYVKMLFSHLGFLFPFLAVVTSTIVACCKVGASILLAKLTVASHKLVLQEESNNEFHLLVIWVFVFIIMSCIGRGFQSPIFSILTRKFVLFYQQLWLEIFLHKSNTFLDETGVFTISTQMNSILSQVLSFGTNNASLLLENYIRLATALGYLMFINWPMALTLIGWLFGSTYLGKYLNQYLRPLRASYIESAQAKNTLAARILDKHIVAKLFVQQHQQARTLDTVGIFPRYHSYLLWTGIYQAVLRASAELLPGILCLLAILLVQQNMLGTDDIAIALFLTIVISAGVREIVAQTSVINDIMASWTKMNKHLAGQQEPDQWTYGTKQTNKQHQNINTATTLTNSNNQIRHSSSDDVDISDSVRIHHIEMCDLSFRFPNKPTTILHDISFTIDERSLTVIVGPSGGGKSTLANLILRLYECEPNMIKINQQCISHIPLSQYRKSIGYVPQDSVFVPGTILENIVYGRQVDLTRVALVTERVQLKEMIDGLPLGLNTVVDGPEYVKLSGGQRQRICIARALYDSPSLILFDEATSALDPACTAEINQLILSLRNDHICLVISHDLSLCPAADQVLYFEKGELVEVGKHQQLLLTNTVAAGYKKLWDTQHAYAHGHAHAHAHHHHHQASLTTTSTTPTTTTTTTTTT